jgi:hypothetical protein
MTSGTLSSFVPDVSLTCVRCVLLLETRRHLSVTDSDSHPPTLSLHRPPPVSDSLHQGAQASIFAATGRRSDTISLSFSFSLSFCRRPARRACPILVGI